MNKEPTVLDYIKSLLTPWRGAPLRIPGEQDGGDQVALEPMALDGATSRSQEAGSDELTGISPGSADEVLLEFDQVGQRPVVQVEEESALPGYRKWPWRALVALGLLLLAQRAFEPGPGRTWEVGAGLYLIAAAWVVFAHWRDEWQLSSIPAADSSRWRSLAVQSIPFWAGAISALLAFLTFGGNMFNSLNLFLWLLSVGLMIWAFWLPDGRFLSRLTSLKTDLQARRLSLGLSRWSLLVLAAVLLVLFFRLYQLNQVPPEMISDHAEKLLDIWDVLHGDTHIFFPRNTGREGLQMYLTAAVIQLFKTDYSFFSMKIGTAFAGLLTLPYVFLLGKELSNRRVGLFAMLFAGIAYWPNVITRVGLRFTLFPLFVAPVLYYFLRGIRRANRNDFILAGISLGIGLHGYTPIRIMPIILIVAVGLYWLHRRSAEQSQQVLWGLGLTGLFASLLFLPLGRFWLDDPLSFGFRSFSRLGSIEQPLPGPALVIFIRNLWNAMTMFTWSNGEIWPVSIPFRPALDVISGGLFHAGVVLLLVRYVRKKNWLDLFLLISIPLLLMPSILSLAFPSENPALNRGAGALVPVFLLVGLALDGLLRGIEKRLGVASGRRLAWGVALALVLISSIQNYDLVFRQYQRNYSLAAWNSSEIGSVIQAYTKSLGEEMNAYVVAYPHWVDTRLVGINAGYPTRDFAIWPEHFAAIQTQPGPKLFVISPQDTDSLLTLQTQYPSGYLKVFGSKVENKNFWMFFVLPAN